MAEGYTRTGDNFLSGISRWMSYIPYFGAPVSVVAGVLGSFVDSVGWLFRGKILSAFTSLGSGLASTVVDVAGSATPLWFVNVGSGLFTSGGLGTHTRALTEGVTSMLTRPLGLEPIVLRSHYAGVGGIAGYESSGPGYWATRAAQERGQDPYARYAAYRSGEGAEHVAALESAASPGQYRGV